jgi:hypothetical protein
VKYEPTLIEVSLAFEIKVYTTIFFFFSFLASVLLRTRGWAICLWEIYVYFILCFSLNYRYELAEECADDDDDAKISISNLRKAVLEELKMHDSFVQVQCSHAFCYLLNCQENVGKQNKLEDEILFIMF